MIGVSMRDLNPLNDKQKAELATMPAAYNDMALAMNNDLLKQIEINKKKTGFTVNETGEVSNEDLFPSIISKFRGHTLLVDFWATWCGPCMRLLPKMEELAEKYKGKVMFYKVNADKEKDLCKHFGVQALPTLFFIPVGGKPIVEVGATPEKYVQIIEEQLLK